MKKRELIFGILCVLLAVLCVVRMLFSYQSILNKIYIWAFIGMAVVLTTRLILFAVKPYNWLYVAYYLVFPFLVVVLILIGSPIFMNLPYIIEYLLPFIFIFMADYLIGQYAKANNKNRAKQVEKLKQQLTELENITER